MYAIRRTDFVDYMPLDSGRHPSALVDIAKQTGAHIIAVTGFHKPMYYDDLHWIYHYSVDQIAEPLIQECEVGMDRYSYNGPLVERLDAKAGVLKGASDYNVIAPVSRKAARSGGNRPYRHRCADRHPYRAWHLRSGTNRAVGEVWGRSENVIICHMDRNPDLYLHKELAATGCFLEYDNASRIKYHPDSHSVELIRGLIEAGHEKRLILGTDFALRSYWKAYGEGLACRIC